MTFPTQILWRGALAAGVLVGLMALSTDAAAQAPFTKDQGKCLTTMGKDAQKITASQGKDYKACFKDESKAKLAESVAECVTLDKKGKVQKGVDKLVADAAGSKCVGPDKNNETKIPEVGMQNDAAAISAAYKALHPALWRDLLGADPNAWLLVNGKADPNDFVGIALKDTSKCQQTIIKDVMKCVDTTTKTYNSCVKGITKGKGKVPSINGGNVVSRLTHFNQCVGEDGKGKILKACTTKLQQDIDKKCTLPTQEDLDLAVPGCAGSNTGNLLACLSGHIDCRMCELNRGGSKLSLECDTCADFDPNHPTVADGASGLLDSEIVCVSNDPNRYPHITEYSDGFGSCNPQLVGGGCTNSVFDPDNSMRCIRKSHSMLTSRDEGLEVFIDYNLGVPFVGDFVIECGDVDPVTGKADCDCGYTTLGTVYLGSVLEWVCLEPDPIGSCDSGVLDCNGGEPLDVDHIGEHGTGDICFSNGECETQCQAFCDTQNGGGFTYFRDESGCGGFCSDDGTSCTADAECLPPFHSAPGGSCYGPQGGVPHPNECQCTCIGVGGNPSAAGALQCESGVTITLERDNLLDPGNAGGPGVANLCAFNAGLAGDIYVRLEPTCSVLTTELASAVMLDFNDNLGVTYTQPAFSGTPAACPFISGTSRTLVGSSIFFDGDLGDLLAPIVTVYEYP